jgi:hypothetical protein
VVEAAKLLMESDPTMKKVMVGLVKKAVVKTGLIGEDEMTATIETVDEELESPKPKRDESKNSGKKSSAKKNSVKKSSAKKDTAKKTSTKDRVSNEIKGLF